MFPDSKIVNKHRCGRTKTIHMLTGAVAKQITSDLKQELLLTRWYGLATDGTSDEDDKFLPILVKYVDKDLGLIVISLLDMPDISSDSTAQQMYDMCIEGREAFYQTEIIGYHNSMIRQRNSLLQKIRGAQGYQKIFDVGCPCHLVHFYAGKEAK